VAVAPHPSSSRSRGEAVAGREQSITTTVLTPAANNKMIQKEINLLGIILLGRLNHKILTSPSKLPPERTIVRHLPSTRTSKLLERQEQWFLRATPQLPMKTREKRKNRNISCFFERKHPGEARRIQPKK
jgi:hypothetical protein